MAELNDRLATLLSGVRRPGDFYAAGKAEFLAPLMAVAGVGLIAFPLLPVQAAQLIDAAEPAPYGRGAETLIDPAVRRSWQIDAARVGLTGKHWARTLATIVARAAEGLGVDQPVEAELYKLLIYDKGSFFVSHRDTEKRAGMFATLVIVLPSISAGGALLVRHKGREARLDLRCDEPSEVAFAAFYADCVHDVLPVTEGSRLTLVYSLLRPGKGRLPEAPNYESEQAKLVRLLAGWTPDDGHPEKLIYPLEHAYTQAELGFGTLKGADAAAAGLLVAAAPHAGCDIHLALLSVEESGPADYADGGGSRGWREPEFEVIEVSSSEITLSEWRRPDGSAPGIGALPVEEDELSPLDILDTMTPDEEHFQEATGNAGASFERSYRRAALVLWPSSWLFTVLGQGGAAATLPYLDDLTARWTAAGADQSSPLWQQAHDLAEDMLARWRIDPYREDEASDVARLLRALTRLGDTVRLEAVLTDIVAAGDYRKPDNDAVLGALACFPAAMGAVLIEEIIRGTVEAVPDACAALLAREAASVGGLDTAATALVEALPGQSVGPTPRIDAAFVVDLLSAIETIDPALAARAMADILDRSATYDPDTILVPAIRTLLGSPLAGAASVRRLHQAARAHVESRVAQNLAPPADWRRTMTAGCTCDDCTELNRFLADPTLETWIFKAAQGRRNHIERIIKDAGSDLVWVTERHGSPHRLVCTKNQASYEQRVKQRAQDLKTLAWLKSGIIPRTDRE